MQLPGRAAGVAWVGAGGVRPSRPAALVAGAAAPAHVRNAKPPAQRSSFGTPADALSVPTGNSNVNAAVLILSNLSIPAASQLGIVAIQNSPFLVAVHTNAPPEHQSASLSTAIAVLVPIAVLLVLGAIVTVVFKRMATRGYGPTATRISFANYVSLVERPPTPHHEMEQALNHRFL